MLLFFVLFFGISFILNMLLRKTWLMAIFFPIILIFIIDTVPVSSYFTDTLYAFSDLWDHVINLKAADVFILSSGLAGTIISGFVIKFLRKQGYQMF
ncbi:YuiB family protein [Bacillaceae bacterium S4-13-58]